MADEDRTIPSRRRCIRSDYERLREARQRNSRKHHPLGNSKDNIVGNGTYSGERRSYPSGDNIDRATLKCPRFKVWTPPLEKKYGLTN